MSEPRTDLDANGYIIGTPVAVAVRFQNAIGGMVGFDVPDRHPFVYSTPFGSLTSFKVKDNVSGLSFEVLVRQGVKEPSDD